MLEAIRAAVADLGEVTLRGERQFVIHSAKPDVPLTGFIGDEHVTLLSRLGTHIGIPYDESDLTLVTRVIRAVVDGNLTEWPSDEGGFLHPQAYRVWFDGGALEHGTDEERRSTEVRLRPWGR